MKKQRQSLNELEVQEKFRQEREELILRMKEEKESKPHIKEEVTSRKKQKLLGIDSSNKNKAN